MLSEPVPKMRGASMAAAYTQDMVNEQMEKMARLIDEAIAGAT